MPLKRISRSMSGLLDSAACIGVGLWVLEWKRGLCSNCKALYQQNPYSSMGESHSPTFSWYMASIPWTVKEEQSSKWLWQGHKPPPPMRVLGEEEITNLSGLGRYWKNTCITDAERLPESLIRDMCGNSFHPALISSALGKNDILKKWIKGVEQGPSTLVANQRLYYTPVI